MHFPRHRNNTSPKLTQKEVRDLQAQHWGYQVQSVTSAQSRCVYYIESSQGPKIFRSNPGWDGPNPPSQIVEYVHHLSKSLAPVPKIIPTSQDALSVHFRDYVISVETRLPGEKNLTTKPSILRSVGQALGYIHQSATSFAPFLRQMNPLKKYVEKGLTNALNFVKTNEEKNSVTLLHTQIQQSYGSILHQPIPWLLCHGDVRAANCLMTSDHQANFTDFNSARYNPALWDLSMTRFQWLMGEAEHSRFLTASESANILAGYHSVRPLSSIEIEIFPVVWATYYAERLGLLHDKWRANSPNRRIWPVEDEILKLPTQALEIGQKIIQQANL